MVLTVGDVHEAIAAPRPADEALVFRERRLSWLELTERTRRLANVLHEAGLGCHTERNELEPWESGQDHLAIYLHNGNEYLEAMLGAFKARVAPFNVNYRYVAEELRYLLTDADARAVVVHSTFAPTLAEVLPDVPAPAARAPGPRRQRPRPACPARQWYEAGAGRRQCRRPPVDALAGRPLHPVHRRHDRHAEGRAVASGRRVAGVLRRAPRPPRRPRRRRPRPPRPPGRCWPHRSCTGPVTG